jgi:hypothetical protein
MDSRIHRDLECRFSRDLLEISMSCSFTKSDWARESENLALNVSRAKLSRHKLSLEDDMS